MVEGTGGAKARPPWAGGGQAPLCAN